MHSISNALGLNAGTSAMEVLEDGGISNFAEDNGRDDIGMRNVKNGKSNPGTPHIKLDLTMEGNHNDRHRQCAKSRCCDNGQWMFGDEGDRDTTDNVSQVSKKN